MQSNTSFAFDHTAFPTLDDAHWASIAPDMNWPPGTGDGGFDYGQFMDFDLALNEASTPAATAAGAGASDQTEQHPDQPAVTPAEHDPPSSISVSATFNLDRLDADGNPPDTSLLTSDDVHFAVNAAKLRANSLNDFGGLLLHPTLTSTVPVPESSAVLNLLLHAIYGISAVRYAPSVDDIGATIEAIDRYGLPQQDLVSSPSSPIYEAIMFMAPRQPLECYALAAHAGLEELAVAVSTYTLSAALHDVTDELAARMGPRYLKRLFFLHLGRIDALKRVIRDPLPPHAPTEDCDGYAEKPFRQAWVKAVADIVWGAGPNISIISLEVRLRDVGCEESCSECLLHLDYRIKKLLVDWSLVNNTI